MSIPRPRVSRVTTLFALVTLASGAPSLATTSPTTLDIQAAVSSRCSTENAERTVNGTQQRCVRNANGVLRWKSTAGSASGVAKVLLVPRFGFGLGYMSGSIYLRAMRDGSAILSGRFAGTTTFGNITIRENQPYWGNSPDNRDSIEDRYLARISPEFDWRAAERFGGSGPTVFEPIGPIVQLSDGSAIVTGRWRGDITLGSKRMATRTPQADWYGLSSQAFFGRLMPDGSWAWADGIGGSGGSEIRSAVETADGSILLSGWYRDSTNSVPDPDDEISKKHFLMIVAKDGSNRRVFSVPTTLSAPGFADNQGASLDFQIASSLADGSSLIVGSYCGTVTFGSLTLPSLSKSRGQKGDCGGFVARVRQDLSFEWVREVTQTEAVDSNVRKNSGISGATLTPNGDLIVIGWLRNGEWKFGNRVVKNPGRGNFVARIDPQGTWRWVQRIPVQQFLDIFLDVQATPDDGAVILGNIHQGSVALGKLRFTKGVGRDGFVAKVSSAGQWMWVSGTKTNTVKDNDVSTRIDDVDVAPDGTVIVAGVITGKVKFGTTTIPSPDWELTGFVARLSPDGVWK